MPSEKEILMIQKATAYDLLNIIEENPDKTYTTDEMRKIIKAYIAGTEQ